MRPPSETVLPRRSPLQPGSGESSSYTSFSLTDPLDLQLGLLYTRLAQDVLEMLGSRTVDEEEEEARRNRSRCEAPVRSPGRRAAQSARAPWRATGRE